MDHLANRCSFYSDDDCEDDGESDDGAPTTTFTAFAHRTETAKFRLFESCELSIEESYLTKRALRGLGYQVTNIKHGKWFLFSVDIPGTSALSFYGGAPTTPCCPSLVPSAGAWRAQTSGAPPPSPTWASRCCSCRTTTQVKGATGDPRSAPP